MVICEECDTEARRTTPPAPAEILHAPAHYIESAAERDDRIGQQKLNDDDDFKIEKRHKVRRVQRQIGNRLSEGYCGGTLPLPLQSNHH